MSIRRGCDAGLGDEVVDAVGEGAEQRLEGRAGEVARGSVEEVSPVQVPVASGRLGVRSPS